MKIEAVLFDMDGTLIDSEPYWLSSEIELMAEFGYIWRTSDQAACLGGPLERVGQYMSDLARGQRDGDYFHHSLVERVSEKFHSGIAIVPGGLEILRDVKAANIPMALVSASPRVLVQAAIDSFPEPFFATSVSSSDVLQTKPHPESYLKAAEALNVNIENCLVIEDSLTGVHSGMASGAWVIAIPHIVPIEAAARVRLVTSLTGQNLESLISLFD
ncbi:MAG: HAD family phosphatase [Actinomycetes bacterium]